MHTPMTRPATDVVAELRDTITGRVVAPGDEGYDEARAVFVGGFDLHPAAVAYPVDADEVARVVTIARESGADLAIRSGGHSGAGYGSTEGGILLDLSALKSIEVDLAGRTVWASTGFTAVELSKELSDRGMAVGFGDTGSVGIGGITLGGGVGYLARKYGLTIDSLLAADVVTADGRQLRVDSDNHPDLFWAIRGGGGNFGVATRFQFRLHELPQIVGGMLMLPATADTIAGFMSLSDAAPEELTSIVNVFPAPPMPFVPEEYHGKIVIMALMAYAGDVEAGQQALAPFRALATPIVDMLKPMPYADIYPPEDPSYHPKAITHTLFVDRVDKAAAELIMGRLEASDATMRAAQLRALGGAVSRVPDDATAYSHRTREIMVAIAVFYEDEADRIVRQAWASSFADALAPSGSDAYVNFLMDEGPERVRAAYPGPTWDRLRAIKCRYDPTNLFHLNQNVPPAE